MRQNLIRRLTTVWPVSVSLMAALTDPADVESVDRGFETLLRQSAIACAARRLGRAFDAVWTASLLGPRFERAARGLAALNREGQVRAVSGVIAIASVTALALDPARPTPVGSWSWLLPVSCAVAGVAGVALAGPLARRSGERRR